MLKNQKGFTLIEMLIVLSIVSILMILIIPNLGEKSKEANTEGCNALVAVVQTQVDAYHLEENKYPTTLDELVKANYLRENQKECPNSDDELTIDESGKVSLPKEAGA